MYICGVLDICEAKGQQLGAFLMEPLMLGAGGLKFIDPLFQKICVQECRLRGIPIVYDEVQSSLYFLSYLHKILFCASKIGDCYYGCCKCGLINIYFQRYLILSDAITGSCRDVPVGAVHCFQYSRRIPRHSCLRQNAFRRIHATGCDAGYDRNF